VEQTFIWGEKKGGHKPTMVPLPNFLVYARRRWGDRLYWRV